MGVEPLRIDGRIRADGPKSDSDANAGSPRVGRRVRFGNGLKSVSGTESDVMSESESESVSD